MAMTMAVAAEERVARWMLGGSMLVMGACGIMYEYALGTLGNHLMGSSHEQIYVIIGIMMFAMGVGADLQRRVASRVLEVFLGAEILLGVLGSLSVLLTYAAFGSMAAYPVVLYGFAFAIGCLIGLEIPLLIRINERYVKHLPNNLGSILTMDYLGSLVGALVFAYLLITRLSVDQIVIYLGMINVVIAALGIIWFRAHVQRLALMLGLVVIALLGQGALLVVGPGLMADIEQRTYADPIVFRSTSPYQHVVVTERDEHTRMYINGQLQFDSRDEFIYHEMLVHPAMALAATPRRVLILGGGDGMAAREVLKYPGVEEVVLVDLDPMITRLASSHPLFVELNDGALATDRTTVHSGGGVSPGEPLSVLRESSLARAQLDQSVYQTAQVQILNLDAGLYLRQAGSGSFDVIILDFPDPHHLELAKLYSIDFYRNLQRLMHQETVLSCQSTSPYHARDAFLCIGKTMRAAGLAAIPLQHNVPSFGQWGWHLAILGGSGLEPVLAHRVRNVELHAETRYLTDQLVRGSLDFGRGMLDDATIAINTPLRPSIVSYYRQAWKH